ncbi:SPASM domain-containing protein [Helicobacter enhydrae]|nr:SPASM domain-containing protein [Helicobacter enhydrae]
MGVELFARICEEIQGKTELIALHLLGDPLLCKDLPRYLDIAQRYALRVEIVTSGFYLKRWDFDLLLSPPIHQCNISLSAFGDVNNPKPKRYLQDVLDLALSHQAKRSETFLNLRMHQSRLDWELCQFFCSAFGVEASFDSMRIRLGYKLFIRLSKDFEWVRGDGSQESGLDWSGGVKKKCHALISQIAFLADGKVVPCCIDCDGGIVLGDIGTQTLEEIFQSPTFVAMKKGFLRGVAVHKQCQQCTYLATLN